MFIDKFLCGFAVSTALPNSPSDGSRSIVYNPVSPAMSCGVLLHNEEAEIDK
jgi:hypothetical protein